jgi:HSP20 family protein
MATVRFAPFVNTEDFPTGLRHFQDSINRLLSDDGIQARPWSPAVDIVETENRMERSYGSFVRYFTVSDTVDAEHVKADYQAGVLTITLPKKEIAKPKAIKVQVSNN